LRALGMISRNGTLLQDPKARRGWLIRLRQALPFLRTPDFLPAPTPKAPLLQAMLVAQARHDHVCDYLTAALMWLEQGGKVDFGALARRYRVVKPAALTARRQDNGSEPTPAEAFAYRLPRPSPGAVRTLLSPLLSQALPPEVVLLPEMGSFVASIDYTYDDEQAEEED